MEKLAKEWIAILETGGPYAMLVGVCVAFYIYFKSQKEEIRLMREGYKNALDLKDEKIGEKDTEIGELQERIEKNLIEEKKESSRMMREMAEALTNVHGSIQTMNGHLSTANTLQVEVAAVLKDVKENR